MWPRRNARWRNHKAVVDYALRIVDYPPAEVVRRCTFDHIATGSNRLACPEMVGEPYLHVEIHVSPCCRDTSNQTIVNSAGNCWAISSQNFTLKQALVLPLLSY